MGRRKKYYHRWDSEGSIGKEREGNGEEWAYVKPMHGGPTMHLMVTGPQPWLTRIHDIVKADGGLNAVYISDLMKPDDVHFFASFDSEKDSVDAKGVLEGMNQGLIASSFSAETFHDASREEEKQECESMATQGQRKKKKKARMPRIAVHYADVEVRQQGSRDGEPDICRAEIDPDACGIPGLIVMHDFITVEEEQELLDLIDGGVWDRLARRRVQHYGAKFSYATRTVDTSSNVPRIPEQMSCLLDRITAQGNISDTLDQITVNEYPVGVGLSPHVDTHSAFGDAIASLSLSEGVTMVFRRDGEQRAVYLPRRSLLVMGGESRWAWEHYIPHRKSDVLVDGHRIQRQKRRVSLTCRSIRHGPCQCPFPEYCDSQLGEIPPTRIGMNHDKAEDTASVAEPVIEKGHVQKVYNAIAPHFSATRFAIWPRVKEFIESIQYGGIVADVGCGNGKYFGIRQDLFVCGSDISDGLASLASKRIAPNHTSHGIVACPKADVCIADGLHTPYRDASCDAALSIAVIHHLSSVQRRVALIDEITRILRVGGRAIITAWATEQENMKKLAKWEPIDAPDPEHDIDGYTTANDYLVPWHVPMHRIEASSLRETGEIDRDRNSIKFKRYYHLFAPGELDRLVELSKQSTLVDAFYDRDNWCIVIEKKPPTYA
ncbi:hypothetical protein M9435_005949 [Picochlorum sp. BPE23]|nr:hypothetical protein M9435_005949 [Picochlorum sp. BPE23]